MSEALAALALVAGDELARAPALLVEHGAALVAEWAAGVVLALALVLLQRGLISTFSYSTQLCQSTEFPISSCREVFQIIFREFPCPAWAVASCSSGPQAGGTP